MEHLTEQQKRRYSFLGKIYLLVYVSTLKRWFGTPIIQWIRPIPFVLAFLFYVLRWGWLALVCILIGVVGIILFFRLRRLGFTRFIPDVTPSVPDQPQPISYNKKLKMRATGLFSVTNREDFVLMRPADYWQVPLGSHIVMVEQVPKHFLYQFMEPEFLEILEQGWILFGDTPHRAISVTFRTTWGANRPDVQTYYVPDAFYNIDPPQKTAYFCFDDEAEHEAVWQNLHYSMQQAQSQKPSA